jgi:hypothetical protein
MVVLPSVLLHEVTTIDIASLRPLLRSATRCVTRASRL